MSPDPTSLERLHDVITPPAVSWWPPAPGWYWLLGALLALAVVAVIRGFLSWQRDRYRREALAAWHHQTSLLTHQERRGEALAGMAELLKRTALSAFPREQVASLTGPAWFAFLDRTAAGTDFGAGSGALLESASYDPRSTTAVEHGRAKQAAASVQRWLKHHRAGGKN